jgi:hypothetical protein
MAHLEGLAAYGTSKAWPRHAALQAAIKQDPKSRWMLLYPGGVAGRYDPPGSKPPSDF